MSTPTPAEMAQFLPMDQRPPAWRLAVVPVLYICFAVAAFLVCNAIFAELKARDFSSSEVWAWTLLVFAVGRRFNPKEKGVDWDTLSTDAVAKLRGEVAIFDLGCDGSNLSGVMDELMRQQASKISTGQARKLREAMCDRLRRTMELSATDPEASALVGQLPADVEPTMDSRQTLEFRLQVGFVIVGAAAFTIWALTHSEWREPFVWAAALVALIFPQTTGRPRWTTLPESDLVELRLMLSKVDLTREGSRLVPLLDQALRSQGGKLTRGQASRLEERALKPE